MARPSHEFAYADGTPEMQLLGAATTGDLALLERMAIQLDGGRGRLAEAVEAVKDNGVGALHLAAGGKKAEVCEFLVEDVRVDVDALDMCGRTPLVWAISCKKGKMDIVKYLLDHGANPNNVDKTGCTPLHEATKIGHCEAVELLLSRGAYVDPISTHHGTPLHVAAEHKQHGAMKILLDHRADVIPLVTHWIHMWSYLQPEDVRQDMDIGCNRLATVARDFYSRCGWRIDRRLT